MTAKIQMFNPKILKKKKKKREFVFTFLNLWKKKKDANPLWQHKFRVKEKSTSHGMSHTEARWTH